MKAANWNDVQAVLTLPLDRYICSLIHLHNMHLPPFGICCSIVGPTHQERHSIVRVCTKFAYKVWLKCWDIDYNNILHCLHLPLINGNTVFPAGIFNLHEYQSLRHNSSIFHRPCSRTNYFYFHNYVPSVIAVWNTLPVDIKSPSSASVFTYCTWLMSCTSLELLTCCPPYLCIIHCHLFFFVLKN